MIFYLILNIFDYITDPNNQSSNPDEELISEHSENPELNVKAVKSLVDAQELAKASQAYKHLIEEFEAETNPSVILKAIKLIDEQKEALKIRLKAISEETEATEPSVKEIDDKVKQLEDAIASIDTQMKDQNLSQDQEAIIEKLQHLVTKNENLKAKETTYKDQVKEEMEKLMAENELLENELKALKAPEVKDDQMEQSLKQELDELRKQLAEKGQKVQLLELELDAIPSRYELAQYQKRFVELDNQVAAEYAETQQFVTMYNTLQDQKTFMEKEIKLLNSILDCIPDAKMSALSTKQNFLEQLERIQYSVKQSSAKTKVILQDQHRLHDSANEELSKLMDLHRTYAVLVRDLQEEMNKLTT